MACGKSGEVRTGRENRQTVPPARETLKSSLPFTHKLHTGLVQVNGFPQGLSPSPDLHQLTRQLLHQGQQFSSDTVSLERIEEADSDGVVGSRVQQIKENMQRPETGEKLAPKGHNLAEKEALPRCKGAGPWKTDRGPRCPPTSPRSVRSP